jgi:hypothetical protein
MEAVREVTHGAAITRRRRDASVCLRPRARGRGAHYVASLPAAVLPRQPGGHVMVEVGARARLPAPPRPVRCHKFSRRFRGRTFR